MSEKQRNEPPVKLTRAEKREIQAIIRKYKGDGKAHSAQASIPYQSMYPDGICKVTANTFSKCIEFADISYLSCSRLYNDYDGIQHDYTKNRGLSGRRCFSLLWHRLNGKTGSSSGTP